MFHPQGDQCTWICGTMPLQSERDAREERERNAAATQQAAEQKPITPPPGLKPAVKKTAEAPTEGQGHDEDAEDDTRSIAGDAQPPKPRGRDKEKSRVSPPGASESSEPDVEIKLDYGIPGVAEVASVLTPGDVAGSGTEEFGTTIRWLKALREGISDAHG